MRQTLFYRIMMAAASVTALLPNSLTAQSLWLDRSHDKTIALEILKPELKNGFYKGWHSSSSGWVVLMSSRWRVSENTCFVSEIPFATGEREYDDRFNNHHREAGNAVGNPYFGMEHGHQNSGRFVEVGIRVPLPSDSDSAIEPENIGRFIGLYSTLIHFEVFTPRTFSFITMINYRYGSEPGPFIRLRGGPSIIIFPGAGGGDGFLPLTVDYGLQGGYESGRFRAGAGYTGRVYGLGLMVHQLGFNANVGLGRIRPGVHFRMPLDKESKEDLNYVLGLNLGVHLQ